MNARSVLLPVVALAAAAAIWVYFNPPQPAGVPAGSWRIGKGTDIHHAKNYEELPAGAAIRLDYHCSEPRHVYVFSHSEEDGTLLMFPSPDLQSDEANPLANGSHVLPGRRDGDDQHWVLRDGVLATTTYIAIASVEPVAELEELLPRLRRWSNTSLTDRSMGVTNPKGDVEVAGRGRDRLPSALLLRAADRSLTATEVNGPMQPDGALPNVWTSSWRAKERTRGK